MWRDADAAAGDQKPLSRRCRALGICLVITTPSPLAASPVPFFGTEQVCLSLERELRWGSLLWASARTRFWNSEAQLLHTLQLQNKCLHVILLPKMSKKAKYENIFSKEWSLMKKLLTVLLSSWHREILCRNIFIAEVAKRDLTFQKKGMFLKEAIHCEEGQRPGHTYPQLLSNRTHTFQRGAWPARVKTAFPGRPAS